MSLCCSLRGLGIVREKNGVRFCLDVPHLDISRGKILAVVGPSGCGKSTLLDVLALVLRPSSVSSFTMWGSKGEIRLDNAAPEKLAGIRGADIGYVLQSGGLLPFMSVADNIMLPSRLLGRPPEQIASVVAELCERLGIKEHLRKKPRHLSGGQRQRVAIARAIAHQPALILADEPTAAVDVQTAEDICRVFTEMTRAYGLALVIVSHDLSLMEKYADLSVSFKTTRLSENNIKSELLPAGF